MRWPLPGGGRGRGGGGISLGAREMVQGDLRGRVQGWVGLWFDR